MWRLIFTAWLAASTSAAGTVTSPVLEWARTEGRQQALQNATHTLSQRQIMAMDAAIAKEQAEAATEVVESLPSLEAKEAERSAMRASTAGTDAARFAQDAQSKAQILEGDFARLRGVGKDLVDVLPHMVANASLLERQSVLRLRSH
mmetsp:Transcript_247/g.847  ORF Transcript_247/g.847 Transcript_247/m.847 type:complete len:147 (+) Transcript_247:51-491(+)